MHKLVHSGWTLLETVLVLGIFCATALLWAPRSGTISAERQEAQFFQDFHSLWLMALYTTVYHEGMTVYVRFGVNAKNQNIVYFKTLDAKAKFPTVSLILPKSLSAKKYYSVWIRKNGVVAPQTLQLGSTLGRKIKIVMQMGWGLYRIEGL